MLQPLWRCQKSRWSYRCLFCVLSVYNLNPQQRFLSQFGSDLSPCSFDLEDGSCLFSLNKQHGKKPDKSCGRPMSTPSAKYESSSEPQPLEGPKLDLCPVNVRNWLPKIRVQESSKSFDIAMATDMLPSNHHRKSHCWVLEMVKENHFGYNLSELERREEMRRHHPLTSTVWFLVSYIWGY